MPVSPDTQPTNKTPNKYITLLTSINKKKAAAVLAALGITGTTVSTTLTPEQQNKAIQAVSPAISQRDAEDSSGKYAYWRVCNPTSNLMLLNQIRPLILKDPVALNVFLESARKRNMEPTVHENMTTLLALYGADTVWNTDGNESNLRSALTSGFGVPVNILHKGSVSAPYGGHVIFVRSYDAKNDKYFISDPWGELNKYSTNPRGTQYELSGSQFRARWQGGYRTVQKSFIEKIEKESVKKAV